MIIEKHEKLYGKESGKAYFQVSIEGKKYNHFKPEWFVDSKEGQKCEATFKEDGQYTNIVSLSMELNGPVNAPVEKIPAIGNEVVPESGNFQSTVWNHTVAPNSYEVGKVGDRFKLYFETPEELQAKIAELKRMGFMPEEFKPEHMLDMSTAARTQ